jgi:hypothetical protein
MLAAESKIDTTNPLTIELFKETLPWGLTLQLMKLETPHSPCCTQFSSSYKTVVSCKSLFLPSLTLQLT